MLPLKPIDKKGGVQWKPTVYRDLIIELMNELKLVDILRVRNPNKKCFTYESSTLKMKSRIDFFLIAKPLTPLTKTRPLILKLQLLPTTRLLDFCCKLEARKEALVCGNLTIRFLTMKFSLT